MLLISIASIGEEKAVWFSFCEFFIFFLKSLENVFSRLHSSAVVDIRHHKVGSRCKANQHMADQDSS